MLLSDRTHGRNNNLNLIRFVAAAAVLISHSYPLALGVHGQDPLQAATGMTIVSGWPSHLEDRV